MPVSIGAQQAGSNWRRSAIRRCSRGSVARALNLSLGEDPESLDALLRAARRVRALLVLDNAEHLLGMTATIAEAMITRAPGVRLLVTSRIPLKLPDEHIYQLGGLAVPTGEASAASATTHGAIALFATRARAADRRFVLTDENAPLAAEICRRLDGNALAIELAAARVPSLGVAAIADRLDERFRLLVGGSPTAPLRHQTVRATLDWTFGLLAAADQTVFRRLGVFAGSFTLEACTAVASDDVLDSWAVVDALGRLVDASMVALDGSDPPRYSLTETARAYALDLLAGSADETNMRTAHAAFSGAR